MADASEVFWGREDDEQLTCTDPDEAIEEILDGYFELENLGDHEIEVIEYRARECVPDAESILEYALERLDEVYGDPGGDYTKPTPAMTAAAEAFAKALAAEYHVWRCEPTGQRITVNALAWVREHRPDWLGPAGATGTPEPGTELPCTCDDAVGYKDEHCMIHGFVTCDGCASFVQVQYAEPEEGDQWLCPACARERDRSVQPGEQHG